jgi:hypothetical protein
MTAGSQTRHLVALDIGHDLRIGVVRGSLFEAARSRMTMQALAMVVRMLKVQRRLWISQILDIDMMQPSPLGFDGVMRRTYLAELKINAAQ